MFDEILLYVNEEETQKTLARALEQGSQQPLVLFSQHDVTNKDHFKTLKKHVPTLQSGLLLTVVKQAQKLAASYDHLFSVATREAIERKEITCVYNAEDQERKDKTHYRNSGLNQVTASLLAAKKKMYCFNLAFLLDAKDQQTILGRMIQNKVLLEKYSVQHALYSFAKDTLDLRSVRERKLFMKQL